VSVFLEFFVSIAIDHRQKSLTLRLKQLFNRMEYCLRNEFHFLEILMSARTQGGIGRRIARLLAMVTFFAVLLAALVHTIFQTRRELENQLISMQATAYALAAATSESVVETDTSKAQKSLTAVSRIPNILMASIVLPDNSTFATMGQTVYLSNDLVSRDSGALALLFKGVLPVSVDIVKGGLVRGRLVMVGDISTLRSQIARSILGTFAAAIVAALLGVVASQPLQRRIVGPLTTLTATIQNIRKSRNYSSALQDDDSPDEAGILVKAFNGLMRDIRSRDDALQKLAYHDPLTGLANRVSFQRSLEEWMQFEPGNTSGSVALVNIHGFRAMNDAFSHSIGDALLMTVAATIMSAVAEDVTVARYGGDEFALLFRSASTENDVEAAVTKVQASFVKPLQIGDLELHVTLTAGAVLLARQVGETDVVDSVLRQVDLALADAKSQVAGKVSFFRPELADVVQEDTTVGQALRQAAKVGDFELHYQAQFDLRANRVSGFEALVRWTHPVRGPISPAIFIPLAERIGLISVIGDWVLVEGCKQAATWYRQGLPERIMSINVSPAQILAAGFVEKVRAALQSSGLPPHLLCLELTESMFVGSRYAETVFVLETLARDGVKLALDDFGTGYSSLGYLSKLPFHTIKIDRAFVSGVDKNARKLGMLRSVVDMVHVLGMTVVAEGAETNDEVKVLRQLGVEKVQGYALARPLPKDMAIARASEIDRTYLAKSA
jgi:diguanylate cyclase (GGDEF)-like protein